MNLLWEGANSIAYTRTIKNLAQFINRTNDIKRRQQSNEHYGLDNASNKNP